MWAARDVRGGGCYEWVTWWQAVVEFGGCGMKKEGVSLFVTHVTLESTFRRARAIALGSRSRPNL